MDEKGKSSTERSEEKGQEEVSAAGSSLRQTAMDSNAPGPSTSVPENRSRFGSSLSLVDHRREPLYRPALTDGASRELADPECDIESQADELVSQDVINDVCRMYCNVIAREAHRVDMMAPPPGYFDAFRALTRLGFPRAFEHAFKATFGAVDNAHPLVLRDRRLENAADAQVPDFLKNILDEYGLSGVFGNQRQPDVAHIHDQSVCEDNGRSGHGHGDRGNARQPFAPSRADNGPDSQSSGSEAKEEEEVE